MEPPSDEHDAWIVVCVGCLRIKRDGRWTKECAADTGGHSAGFCDRCAKQERKRMQAETKLTTGLRPRRPLSE